MYFQLKHIESTFIQTENVFKTSYASDTFYVQIYFWLHLTVIHCYVFSLIKKIIKTKVILLYKTYFIYISWNSFTVVFFFFLVRIHYWQAHRPTMPQLAGYWGSYRKNFNLRLRCPYTCVWNSSGSERPRGRKRKGIGCKLGVSICVLSPVSHILGAFPRLILLLPTFTDYFVL